MHPLITDLLKSGPVVTDGSWGSQMQRRGLRRGECPDSWNLTRPELVEEVARAYVEAGSRVILTNTFGANRLVLAKANLAGQAAEINRRGVEISKKAAAGRALVFASIGPSGKILMTKEVTESELDQAFEEQAATLASAGADALVVETMIDLTEAGLAVQAAKRTGLPVVACMVFDSGRNKDRTMMGQTPEQAAEALAKLGADVIGANCGQGIDGFPPICRRLKAATDLPIWMKPNAGLPEMVAGQTVYRTSAREFAGRVPELIAAGADFIGACCGSDEEFIREIKKAVEAGSKK
ncbi:MAG: homocysteine S-methyltransferase family protein [Thermodesulfobacteriota bacterium]